MSYQDRYYYRDSQSDRSHPLSWLVGGTVPFLTAAGIRMRLHSSMLLLAAIALVTGLSAGYSAEHRVVFMAMLLVVVILHELGHGLATRQVGGHADEAVLWPLGGLADMQPPHRPLPAFTAALAGPVVNLVICAITAGALQVLYHAAAPHSPHANFLAPGNASEPRFYLWYLYTTSYIVLVFNLLPIYPLDGGRILQTILWPVRGYGRSMVLSCDIGMAASVLVAGYGIFMGQWLIAAAMALCLAYCVQKRVAIKAAGIWAFDEYDTDVRRPRRHRLSRFTKWRARRQIRLEEVETLHVDVILSKVYARGLSSLTWREKRALRRATDRQRQREMEETPYPG